MSHKSKKLFKFFWVKNFKEMISDINTFLVKVS